MNLNHSIVRHDYLKVIFTQDFLEKFLRLSFHNAYILVGYQIEYFLSVRSLILRENSFVIQLT